MIQFENGGNYGLIWPGVLANVAQILLTFCKVPTTFNPESVLSLIHLKLELVCEDVKLLALTADGLFAHDCTETTPKNAAATMYIKNCKSKPWPRLNDKTII